MRILDFLHISSLTRIIFILKGQEQFKTSFKLLAILEIWLEIVPVLETRIMTSDIYQKLWDIDLETNGCTVSLRDEHGDWIDPEADILIDQQGEATVSIDQAPAPLFNKVNTEKLNGPTYQALIALLDNYVAKRGADEDLLGSNAIEDGEIEAFLETIISTQVMQAALEYVNTLEGNDFSNTEFKAEIKRLWFEIYTNYFGGNALSFCSGFEHIVVGEEGKSNSIGGYHSWLKFYLDEKNNRIDFRGYNYDGNLGRASRHTPSIPYVITLSLAWEPKNILGNSLGVLTKNQGGFFVGPSPELDIAMPTVAYFENEANLFRGTDQRVTLQGGIIDLVLYRSTNENQTRGDKLRSFFPKFIRPTDGPVIVIEPGKQNAGDIRILRALVNPEGEERGKEWVDLNNSSEQIIDLRGWSIADRLGRKEPLDGIIEPNKIRRFFLTQAQLTNKGGEIQLLDKRSQLIAKVNYGQSQDEEILFFGEA